ncbi:hypothetical protein TrLO_g5070 [Triparma laevis f. longispina]|uniref:Uncharacterized protein n=1 Tax=Triparma laevis f. longispina TaxID=1714387 RepID=A0A9W7DPM9_9STRA|nr:hypothetical protein TrLO_g5070 [Triparma laevis f. longispina]
MTGNTAAMEAKERVAIRLGRLGGGMTKLDFTYKIELGFGISRGAVKHFVERRLNEVIEVSIYFQRLVPLEEYREADGVALAHDLLWMAPSGKKRVERLAEIVEKSRAMRELTETLPWFETMMVIAVRGNESVKGWSRPLLLVAVQNHEKGVLRILKEMAFAVTGMKAAVDAYRVASGAEHEKDTEFDPITELTISKLIEMFPESVPGILIQTSAILNNLNSGLPFPMSTYISLLVLIMTTGFVSATLSYDYDTDPKKRAFNPEFYGYVPHDSRKRAALFFTMILMPADQVFIHGILVVILGSIARSYALYYLVGNMLLCFIYKAG